MADTEHKKLVEKFLSNKCDYLEAEAAFGYLEGNIDALDKIMFSEDLDENEILRCTESQKERTYNTIMGKKAPVVRLFVRKIAVAAAILMSILGAWYYLSQNKKSEPRQVTAIAEVRIENTTQQNQMYALPDGSEVVLRPEAAIFYKKNFNEIRTINLVTGDAYFKVFHDKKRPFEVLSNGIATRALGTRFWVRNFDAMDALGISLTEGKVMIYSGDSRFAMEPVYLRPGQTCSINKKTGKVAVSNSTEEKRPATSLKPAVKASDSYADRLNRIKSSTHSIEFTNTTLKNVFAKLEDRYNVKIVADDPHIMRYNITGTIFYRDSLDVIMKSICELNNLMYEKRNDSLYLKKR
ncbi:FecR family protein [Niabella beijingensis]|uniref:FecR family protein n=1 Tax=Niabella beijingensis TaxID=2872700 RepID=UPI001CBF67DB|nr:FecR domain-containing protein [Niabella beijingensis]MBZ4192283.1 DUF4974 domain-containing protein [Niabella beijingensis]